MRTTIDRAGRVVIPKAPRDALSLGEGAVVDVHMEDGRIILEARPVGKHVVEGPMARCCKRTGRYRR